MPFSRERRALKAGVPLKPVVDHGTAARSERVTDGPPVGAGTSPSLISNTDRAGRSVGALPRVRPCFLFFPFFFCYRRPGEKHPRRWVGRQAAETHRVIGEISTGTIRSSGDYCTPVIARRQIRGVPGDPSDVGRGRLPLPVPVFTSVLIRVANEGSIAVANGTFQATIEFAWR